MSGKVIDLDPNKRISKEALERIQKSIASFDHETLSSLTILYIDKDGYPSFEAFGMDWAMLGIAQAYLEWLRAELLNDQHS